MGLSLLFVFFVFFCGQFSKEQEPGDVTGQAGEGIYPYIKIIKAGAPGQVGDNLHKAGGAQQQQKREQGFRLFIFKGDQDAQHEKFQDTQFKQEYGF